MQYDISNLILPKRIGYETEEYLLNIRKWGLLHEVSEMITGDLSRPAKHAIPEFKRIENNIDKVVAERFSLSKKMPKEVKEADNILLMTERRDLMKKINRKWELDGEVFPLKGKIIPLSPKEAEKKFLEKYNKLFNI